MSALAGFWGYGRSLGAGERCDRMLLAQEEYGPDGTARAQLDGLAVGRNLYRLLPEDEHDRQPLVSEDGCFALVADVRLDNRQELLEALDEGDRHSAVADAEILFRAVLRWGDDAFDQILGDYAFAFYDARDRRLTLARDPLGQRPLFWHRGSGFVAFSSMPKGLHAIGIARQADEETLGRFVGGLPPIGANGYYAGIERVEPGHFVTISPTGASSRRHWAPRRQELRLKRFDDYVAAFRAELDRSVACRLRGANGRVAAHLSGGWDSSAVAATAARLMAPSGGRVIAYTAVPRRGSTSGAPGERFVDERPNAAATASLYLNMDHVLVEYPARSPIADLDRHVALFDRPLFNLCNHVWLSDIRKAARAAGARILLTGEIGNWTISAGPDSILADFIREGRWLAWLREATGIIRSRRAHLRGVLANSFGAWTPDFIWDRLRRRSSAAEMASAAHPRLREVLRAEQKARRLGLAARPGDNFRNTVEALFEMDWGEYRKGILAGWGIDKRDATADRRLIEFCLSLPIDMLLQNGVRRPLARAALADRLPAVVLEERRKGYQAADWHEALTRDLPRVKGLVDSIAADPTAAKLIDVDFLGCLVADWPQGGWEQPQVVARYRLDLLHALSAGHFVLTTGKDRHSASCPVPLDRASGPETLARPLTPLCEARQAVDASGGQVSQAESDRR